MAKRVPKTKCDVLKYYINGECAHQVQNPAMHNLRVICAAKEFFYTTLDKQQFYDLCVGTIKHIRDFLKEGRTLEKVARAIQSTGKRDTTNWWIERVFKNKPRFEKNPIIKAQDALIVRELTPGEARDCPKTSYYLQDGTKRALAYTLVILEGKRTFQPVPVYVCDKVDFSKI